MFLPSCIETFFVFDDGGAICREQGSWASPWGPINGLDGVTQLLSSFCVCITLYLLCFLFPPGILHCTKFSLCSGLAVFERRSWGGSASRWRQLSSLSYSFWMTSLFSSNQSWWCLFLVPRTILADSMTASLNFVHFSSGRTVMFTIQTNCRILQTNCRIIQNNCRIIQANCHTVNRKVVL